MKKHLKILILLPFIFYSTISFGQSDEKEFQEQHKRLFKNEQKIKPYIQKIVDEMTNGVHAEIEGEKIYAKDVLVKFYQYIDYTPAWENFEVLQDAVKALEGSYFDGLLPTDYHVDVMISIIEKIKVMENKGDIDYEWVAKFDLLMTDAIMLYGYHLLDGKIDPHDLDVQWNFGYTELPGGDGKKLAEAINNGTLIKELHKLRPDTPAYGDLMNVLAKYRSVAEKGGWGYVPDGGKIDPRDTDPRISSIRKRLKITGNLTDTTNLANETYDPVLEKDIRYFQERHGLDNDGIIGKATFAALNVSVEKRIDQIRVNLERYRWVVHNLSEDYIVVNIARFKAYVVKNSEVIHSTNVQVGTHYNKTPVFKSILKYIEFNPTWTVPRSITVKEMIPKMKKDHNYLQSKNMVLLDGSGNIVPMSYVDFNSISPSNFPYTIRQEPGPGNALGEVKFIFPNQYSVYLHDTPSKYLFNKSSRSFSHGCIRTQNPIALAEVLLEGTEWDKKKIQESLDSKKTSRAYFNEPVDVLLLYWTVGVYQEKSIFFFPDIYNRDQAILNKLNKDVENVVFE